MTPEREHNEIQRIEAYLAGRMDGAQKLVFETDCEADSALQRLFEEHLMASIIVQRSGKKDQKGQWNDLRAEMQATKTESGAVVRLRPYLIAAAILFLLLWGGLMLFVTTPASAEDLFTEYYQRPQAPERMGSTLVEAERYYRQADFDKAIASYEALVEDSLAEIDNNSFLYWGIAYLEVGQVDSALARFAELRNLQEMRQWYEALAYLKKGDLTQTKHLLMAIKTDPQHFYHAKATGLLADLD